MKPLHAPATARDTADETACHLIDSTMFWSPSGGGVQRYLRAKHAWLARTAGWRHTVFAPGARGWGFVDAGGVPLPRTGGFRLPLDRQACARNLARLEPDLIEAGDPFALGWAALDAGQRLGVPVLGFCHSDLVERAASLVGGQGLRQRWARRTMTAYLARAWRDFDLVLAPSRTLAEHLRALGIVHVEQQPLGVDCSVFSPERRDPALRQELGLPAGARLLLYAGRFVPEKNLQVLAEAVRRLGRPYLLLLVGEGAAVPHGAHVRRLPYEPRPAQLARLMASVDAFVHAGAQEGFGLAPLEAMACGTPTLLRNAGALAELAQGGAAATVDSDRPAEWAEAIAALFAGNLQACGQAARRRAEQQAWSEVLPLALCRYHRLMHGRRLTGEEATQPALHWCGVVSGKDATC